MTIRSAIPTKAKSLPGRQSHIELAFSILLLPRSSGLLTQPACDRCTSACLNTIVLLSFHLSSDFGGGQRP